MRDTRTEGAGVTDIATWLGQQLDEDKQRALGSHPGPWVTDLDDPVDENVTDERGQIVAWVRARPFTDATRDHIAHHNPPHVLQDVEAKQEILAQYVAAVATAEQMAGSKMAETANVVRNTLGQVVRVLAEAYAERPGFKGEWRA